MTRKRVLALMLASAISVSLLAGCGSQEEQKQESSKTSEVKESKSEEAEESKEEPKEPVTIKILADNTSGADGDTQLWEDGYLVADEFKKMLADMGIELEIEYVINSQIGQTVRNRFASGVDVPDLTLTLWNGITDVEVMDWANNGMIASVSDLLEKYDTDNSVQAFYDEYAPGMWGLSKNPSDGKVYWFTYLYNAAGSIDADTGKVYTPDGIFTLNIRKDWVEAAGEELKTVYTPDELYDLMKKVQDVDPNGNGAKDEILAVDYTGFWNGIATAYGLNENGMVGVWTQDGKVTNNFFNENYTAYVEYMQKLYDAGLVEAGVNPEEKIAADQAIGYYHYASWNFENLISEEDIGVRYQSIILDLDGDISNGFNMARDPRQASYGQWIINNNSSEEVKEAIIKLMDWWYSVDGARMIQFGVEGSGYNIDENGNVVNITQGELKEWASLRDTNFAFKVLPTVFVMRSVAKVKPEESTYAEKPGAGYLYDKAMWCYNFLSSDEYLKINDWDRSPVFAYATEEETAKIDSIVGTLESYTGELHAEIMIGNISLDDLEAEKDELIKLGMQDYIDVMQARYDRAH